MARASVLRLWAEISHVEYEGVVSCMSGCVCTPLDPEKAYLVGLDNTVKTKLQACNLSWLRLSLLPAACHGKHCCAACIRRPRSAELEFLIRL